MGWNMKILMVALTLQFSIYFLATLPPGISIGEGVLEFTWAMLSGVMGWFAMNACLRWMTCSPEPDS